MVIPQKYRAYLCDDYYSSSFAVNGHWDREGELWLIEPAERVEEDEEGDFLQVGRPGVDSIGFGYRKDEPGFWALHRIVDREFQYLARSVSEFIEGWHAGEISV